MVLWPKEAPEKRIWVWEYSCLGYSEDRAIKWLNLREDRDQLLGGFDQI